MSRGPHGTAVWRWRSCKSGLLWSLPSRQRRPFCMFLTRWFICWRWRRDDLLTIWWSGPGRVLPRSAAIWRFPNIFLRHPCRWQGWQIFFTVSLIACFSKICSGFSKQLHLAPETCPMSLLGWRPTWKWEPESGETSSPPHGPAARAFGFHLFPVTFVAFRALHHLALTVWLRVTRHLLPMVAASPPVQRLGSGADEGGCE